MHTRAARHIYTQTYHMLALPLSRNCIVCDFPVTVYLQRQGIATLLLGINAKSVRFCDVSLPKCSVT